jgi:hypothetical protein
MPEPKPDLDRVIWGWLALLPHCDPREHEVDDLIDRIMTMLV